MKTRIISISYDSNPNLRSELGIEIRFANFFRSKIRDLHQTTDILISKINKKAKGSMMLYDSLNHQPHWIFLMDFIPNVLHSQCT